MPEFTITVSSDNVKIIQYIANKTGKTGVQLVEEKIDAWAHGQIQGFFIDKIKDLTTEELINLLGDII